MLKTFYFPAQRSDPSCSNKVSYKCRYSELTCSPQSQQVQLFWSRLVQIEQQSQLRYSNRNTHEQQFKFDGCLKIYMVAVSDDLQCTKNNTWLHEWVKWLSNSQVILPVSCQRQLLCQIQDTCSPLQSDNDFPPANEYQVKNENIILNEILLSS